LNLEKGLEQFMAKYVDKFIRKNKEYLDLVIERASSRHRFQELKDASKVTKKLKKQRVEKLLDANERRDRSKCTLFICEGDSAIGGLRSARDKLYQGGIALKGKPLNVSQATVKDVIENSEFADIMGSIGLMLGEPVDFDKLFYSKIVFLADSDVDGGHINTLLTNFFYTFWPELFERGMIQLAKAPLFEVVTDKDTLFVEIPEQLEQMKKRKDIKIKAIHRNKGLGEMSPEAWKQVMSRENYMVISANDAENAKKMLDICFGKDTNLRKDLLLDPDGSSMSMNDNTSAPSGSSVKAAKKTRAKAKAAPAAKAKKKASTKTKSKSARA